MTTRLPSRPSRPAPLPAGVVGVAAVPASEKSANPRLAEFEEMLREDPTLDDEMRAMLREHFELALDPGGDVSPQVPERGVWMETVQALQATGELSEDDVNALIRQINGALEPLQRRDSEIALEFSRRLATDGEEEALAWFRSQQVAKSAVGVHAIDAGSGVGGPAIPHREDVVNSKSRRLRGPP